MSCFRIHLCDENYWSPVDKVFGVMGSALFWVITQGRVVITPQKNAGLVCVAAQTWIGAVAVMLQ
jgi:hypothetical protein